MEIIETLKHDETFKSTLIEFLNSYNENVDWDMTLQNFVLKNKTDEQIYKILKTYMWTDSDEEIKDDTRDVYTLIHKTFLNYAFDECSILKHEYNDVPSKVEFEYEYFTKCLINYLNARLIKNKIITEITSKDKHIISYDWLLFDIPKNNNVLYVEFKGIKHNDKHKRVFRNILINLFS